MREFVGQGQRLVDVCQRLIGVPEEPEGYSGMRATSNKPILA